MLSLDVFMVKNLWGNMLFDFTTSSARGRSGGTWMDNNADLLFISVYFPQELSLKKVLWDYMLETLNRWHDSWNNDGISASNSMILFKNKLKILKQILKEWSSIKRRNKDHNTKVIQDSLIEIDLRIDKGDGLLDDLTKRANLFCDLKDIDLKDSIDLAQKAKIKWAVEGNENFKFFHGIMNKKRIHLAIKGILVDGEWIENPNHVKSEFYSYYSNLFSALAWDRSLFDVEDMVSNKEIKRAVWDSDNLVIGDIVSQEQSAFIKGRQIMDGTLLLNEVISWCNARKEQLLMFKVDFQKAFDSVRLDHLDDILGKFSLKVNVHKSSIYGVGVRQADVQHMAENFGCIRNNLPITYLGVKVGANMMRLNSWSDVVKKVSNKLSNWKDKTLSIMAVNKLKVKGVDLMGFCKIVIGNGSTTRFWHDIWYGDICFKETFKRLFNLELQKNANVASKSQASNVASSFRRPPRSRIENLQFIELGQILSSISLSSYAKKNFGSHVNVYVVPYLEVQELDSFLLEEASERLDFYDIVSHTYFWLSNMCRSFNLQDQAAQLEITLISWSPKVTLRRYLWGSSQSTSLSISRSGNKDNTTKIILLVVSLIGTVVAGGFACRCTYKRNICGKKQSAEKARRRGEVFNWQNSTYVKMECEDLDSFVNYEVVFLAIVYDDASTSSHNVSSEPSIDESNLTMEQKKLEDEERVLDLEAIHAALRQDLAVKMRMVYTGADGREYLRLSMIATEPRLIDMAELGKLNNCMERGCSGYSSTRTCTITTTTSSTWQDYIHEIDILEEEVQGLHRDIRSLHGLVESSTTAQVRVLTWIVSSITQLLESSGRPFQDFTFDDSYQRHTKRCTDDVGTSTPAGSASTSRPFIHTPISFCLFLLKKMVSLDVFVVKNLWGHMLFDFTTSSARGRSGGTWMANNVDLLFIYVYFPQELSLKKVLWDYMLETLNRWHGEVIIMGDFNEGYSFTWSDKHASKMSKLDRPIFLKETHVDYAPTLFRLYHSWFMEDDFHSVIEDSWNNDGIFASNFMILFKNKLKLLKHILKEWSSIKRRNKDHDRKVIQDSLIEIDLRLDKGNGLLDDLTKRANLFRDLKDIDHKGSIDLAQKAKIK
nr:hypothetical protein [Tanacetum cinerariifolium]